MALRGVALGPQESSAGEISGPLEESTAQSLSLRAAAPTLLPQGRQGDRVFGQHLRAAGVCDPHAQALHLRRHGAPGAHPHPARLQAQPPGQHGVPVQGEQCRGLLLPRVCCCRASAAAARLLLPALPACLPACSTALPSTTTSVPGNVPAQISSHPSDMEAPPPVLNTLHPVCRWATTPWTFQRQTCWCRSRATRGRGARRRSAWGASCARRKRGRGRAAGRGRGRWRSLTRSSTLSSRLTHR